MSKKRQLVKRDQEAGEKIASVVLELVGRVPRTTQRKRRTPELAAQARASSAAAKAALAAGTLALPPGPVGWLTILPEMLAVWRIQAQVVADIAAIYGKKSMLTQEQMIYCLFRHTAAQAVRDLVVRVGERALVRRASLGVMQAIATRIGIRVTQRSLGKGISRLLPLVGAVGVGGYAYYDTVQVARTAMELFAKDIDFETAAREVQEQ